MHDPGFFGSEIMRDSQANNQTEFLHFIGLSQAGHVFHPGQYRLVGWPGHTQPEEETMDKNISSTPKYFAAGSGQNLSQLHNWLTAQQKEAYMTAACQRTKDNPSGFRILVSTRPPQPAEAALLASAVDHVLSADRGLPLNASAKREIKYSAMPDDRAPLTVTDFLKTTKDYAEVAKKRLAQRTESCRIVENNEADIRKHIGNASFLVMRKLFSRLPSRFDRTEESESLKEQISNAMSALDQHADVPRLRQAIAACLKNATEAKPIDFPPKMLYILGCLDAFLNQDQHGIRSKTTLIAALNHDDNLQRERSGEKNSTASRRTPETPARQQQESQDAREKGKPRATEAPRLEAVERTSTSVQKPKKRSERAERRRQLGMSMPTLPSGATRIEAEADTGSARHVRSKKPSSRAELDTDEHSRTPRGQGRRKHRSKETSSSTRVLPQKTETAPSHAIPEEQARVSVEPAKKQFTGNTHRQPKVSQDELSKFKLRRTGSESSGSRNNIVTH